MSTFRNTSIAIALLFAIAFTGYAPAAHAQVATPTIASLQAQIALLQAQLKVLKGGGSVKAATTTATGVEIKRVTTSTKPTISGTADDLKKVYVIVTKDGTEKPVLKKSVRVSRDAWKTRVTKKLGDGEYTVKVYESQRDDEVLATTEFSLGKKAEAKASAASGSFSVSLVPLLMGGTARAGQEAAVSYLKVINTSKETQTLTGVTLAQRGTAPTSAVARMTIKDDKDGSKGEAQVTGATVTVPTTSVFAPGQMKLFTIKAVLAGSAGASYGKTLQYEVTGVSGGKGAFPIRGTTWTIGF